MAALVGAAVFALNSAAAPALLGDQTVEASHDSTGGGLAEAFQVTAAASGSLDTLTVYVDSTSTANALTAGIYADANGHPGSLLSQGTLLSPAKAAWNSVALPPAQVTGGTSYWIALLSPLGAGVLQFRDVARTGTSQTSASASLTSLPGTWSGGTSYNDGRLSAYATGGTGTQPLLKVTPSAVSFSGQVAAADPAGAQLSVVDGGGSSYSFSASADSPWLLVTPTSGTVPQTLQVSASLAGLSAGTYTGHLTVAAPGAQALPATVTVTLVVSDPPPDTTPPAVSITAPANNASVSGSVAVSANASDNVGVVGVQFKLDGTNLGNEVTSPPYGVSWDTRTVTSGNHVLTAVARDAAGNITTSNPVTAWVGPPSTVLFGLQTVGARGDSNHSGEAEAFQTVATATGTLSDFELYIDQGSTASSVVAGVYADNGGHPGRLLTTGSANSLANAAWNDIPLPMTTITAGATYWVAILAPAGAGTIRYRDAAGATSETSASTSLADLPSTWATGTRYGDGPVSAYGLGYSIHTPPPPPPSAVVSVKKVFEGSDTDRLVHRFALTAPVPAGDTLVLTHVSTIDATDGSGGIVTPNGVNDPNGDLWQQDAVNHPGTTSLTVEVWSAFVTAALPAGSPIEVDGYSRGLSDEIAIFDVSGLAGSSQVARLDQKTSSDAYAGIQTTPYVTVAQDHELLLAVVGQASLPGPWWTPESASPPWVTQTDRYDGGDINRGIAVMTREVTTSGSYRAGGSLTSASTGNIVFVTYKAAS